MKSGMGGSFLTLNCCATSFQGFDLLKEAYSHRHQAPLRTMAYVAYLPNSQKRSAKPLRVGMLTWSASGYGMISLIRCYLTYIAEVVYLVNANVVDEKIARRCPGDDYGENYEKGK